MIELVLIIVIVGILATTIIPRTDRNSVLEAANQIVSHIRYTQHLAMLDHRYDYNDGAWYKSRWTIEFTANKDVGDNDCSSGNCLGYQVYRDSKDINSKCDDKYTGNLNSATEVAKDPQNPSKFLSAGWSGISGADKNNISKSLNIEKTFGIVDVRFSKSCGSGTRNNNRNKSISFDKLGRPYLKVSTTGCGGAINHIDRRLADNCDITLLDGTNSAVIRVHKETGYVELVQFPSSL